MSIFDSSGSTFDSTLDSFDRWLDSFSSGGAYTVTVANDERMVLGYPRDCPKFFERVGTRCAEDRLCYCLARLDGKEIETIQCAETSSALNVVADDTVPHSKDPVSAQPSGCAASHGPEWWIFRETSGESGIYVFTPDPEGAPVQISVNKP